MTSSFVAGKSILLRVDLLDTSGGDVVPVAGGVHTFFIRNGAGVDLQTGTVSLTEGDSSASISVSEATNTVSQRVEGRSVRLLIQTEIGFSVVRQSYVLVDDESEWIIPSQSIQSYEDALSMAFSMRGLTSWSEGSEKDRHASLLEASSRISRMRLNPFRHYEDPDSSVMSDEERKLYNGEFRITDLTAENWAWLPIAFKTACRRAQLVEADVLMNGDPTWDRRVDGLMSISVGESAEMFRPGKPVVMSLSNKAMRELTGFITFSVGVRR
jgi:hypothetical protein